MFPSEPPLAEEREKQGKWRWPSSARSLPILIVVFLAGSLLFKPSISQAQEIPTSTPDAEGNIYIVVQPNDSLWSIAARANLTLPELLQLNEIGEDHVLQPGDLLLTGRVAPPATATSDIPTPTLPPPTPIATSIPLRTAICMLAFEDSNRDGAFDPGEPLRGEVAFTVFNEKKVVANYITDGISEPYCLEGLEAGTYHVTRSMGHNETLTTQGDWAMTLTYGSELNLAFGSYQQEEGEGEASLDSNAQFETRIAGTPVATPTALPQSNSPTIAGIPLMMVLLAIGIIALLLAVAVLIFWFAYTRTRNT